MLNINDACAMIVLNFDCSAFKLYNGHLKMKWQIWK